MRSRNVARLCIYFPDHSPGIAELINGALCDSELPIKSKEVLPSQE